MSVQVLCPFVNQAVGFFGITLCLFLICLGVNSLLDV